MCKIRPFVDLEMRTLTVSAPGMPDLVLPLNWGSPPGSSSSTNSNGNSNSRKNDGISGIVSVGHGDGGRIYGGRWGEWERKKTTTTASPPTQPPMVVRVCGNQRAGVPCAASASAWFTRFLGVPCSLVRAADSINPPSLSSFPAGGDSNAAGAATAVAAAAAATAAAAAAAVTASAPFLPSPLQFLSPLSRLGGGAKPKSKPNLDTKPQPEACSAATPAAAAVTAAITAPAAADRAFANEAQYLLISRASVANVNDVIRQSFFADADADADEEADAGGQLVLDEASGGGHASRGRKAPEKVIFIYLLIG